MTHTHRKLDCLSHSESPEQKIILEDKPTPVGVDRGGWGGENRVEHQMCTEPS